ncbi:Sjogren's syndrome/scleroderma autoantigen 1 family protein [Natronorubrum sp. DTA28]|uniref:Sjogren's syndrome/scleroderma autoantigen 1 family protein n=1 Tax=Natronorubrum sp. DTA28 TaxID=3447019 RepID=UPI003F846624
MSDFDKEAEREKLREKYERDEREREATQRMSDLLLKGATMTNAHCGTCGDPLFQEDDTTFCPSCHGNPDAVQGTELEAQPADEETADTEAQQTDPTPSTPTDAEVGQTGADSSPAVDSAAAPGHDPADADGRDDSSPELGSAPDAESSTVDEPRPEAPSPTPSPRSFDGRRPAAGPSPADDDLEAAHASLVQALEKFATKAAETDDPRYAKECLEAAREASETLETLR